MRPIDILPGRLADVPGRAPAEILAVEGAALREHATHAVSRVRLTLADGHRIGAVFKYLHALPDKDSDRELRAYRSLLADGSLGAPRLYASCGDPASPAWLLLEDVGDRQLRRCPPAARAAAARWLARMHAAHHDRAAQLRALGWLSEHGEQFYASLAAAARERVAGGAPPALEHFDTVTAGLGATIAVLDDQPRTLVHGDLSDRNVLGQQQRGRWRIRPIDWEWIAIGAGATDLDRLLASPGAPRAQLIGAYADELVRNGVPRPDPCELDIALAHSAVARLVWSLGCPPPLPRWVRLTPDGVGAILAEIVALQDAATAR
jgi:streptomycin 6-kinase